MSGRWRRILVACLAIAAAGIAAVLAGAMLAGALQPSVVATIVDTSLPAEEQASLAQRGRYIAAAADCAACHTAPDGAPWAGGVAFPLPFGVLYSTNISPDPATGIGGWTRAEFHRALRDGVAPHGRQLYPAMPYVSYRQLTEADVDALYAYLLTREPIRQANRDPSLPFGYVRPLLRFWNLLHLPRRGGGDDTAQPAEWNRGRYLVDALGHCGECHTPRDVTLGMIAARYLQGSVIDGMEAPDITPAGLARLGFGRDALARTLRAGSGPQGVMNFAMYDVVHNSTRHLTEPDAAAMAGYLAGARTPLPSPVPHASDPGPDGRRVYVTMCSGCHGLDGEGVPHTAPPMRGNAELRYATAHNLLAIIIDGLCAVA